ncbi:MAG: outer membrane protein, partial [Candidatus Eiseniibacteriota bacterium]
LNRGVAAPRGEGNMKRTAGNMRWLGVFLALAVFAPAAAASAPGNLEISAGYAKCSTHLGASEESMGGSVTIGMSYWKPVSTLFSIGAELSMDDLGDAVSDTYDIVTSTTFHEQFSTHILRANPAIRMNLGATVGPSLYAQAGAGWYRITWDYLVDNALIQAESGGSSTELGFNVGAGLGYPVGPRTRLNVTGTYHIVPGNSLDNMEDTNNAQIRMGLGFEL